MKVAKCLVLLVVAGCVLSASIASAATVIGSHVGNNDPTTEGWTKIAGGAGTVPILSAITFGGVDAWEIDDTDGTSTWHTYYSLPVTTGQADSMIANGFTFAVRMRIPAASHNKNTRAIEFDVSVQGTTESKGLGVFVGSAANNDPILGHLLSGTGEVTMTGLGGGFHDYLFRYDPNTDLVTVTVDGNAAISQTADTGLGLRVWFGSVVGSGEGLSQWSDITLSEVPEPATLALLAAGGMLMVARRRQTG